MTDLQASPKPGWQSTEFAATVVTALGMVTDKIPQQYVPYVTIAVTVYTAARTILKTLHVMGYAKQVPDLPQLPPGTTQTTATTTIVPK